MKTSIWDILSVFTLFGILVLLGVFGAIWMNPNVVFNPFKPPQLVAPIAIPSPTSTTVSSNQMPPTWTPSPPPQSEVVVDVPTLRPSSTPVPTNTSVFLPTFTPTLTLRAGRGGGACSIIFQSPPDGTAFDKDADINPDARWTIKNTSGTEWRKDSADVKYQGGDRFHLIDDIFDLPYDVSTGSMVDITIKMRAPDKTGTYTSNWSIIQGGVSVCNFYLQIRVR
jgi:hypothetical protein